MSLLISSTWRRCLHPHTVPGPSALRCPLPLNLHDSFRTSVGFFARLTLVPLWVPLRLHGRRYRSTVGSSGLRQWERSLGSGCFRTGCFRHFPWSWVPWRTRVSGVDTQSLGGVSRRLLFPSLTFRNPLYVFPTLCTGSFPTTDVTLRRDRSSTERTGCGDPPQLKMKDKTSHRQRYESNGFTSVSSHTKPPLRKKVSHPQRNCVDVLPSIKPSLRPQTYWVRARSGHPSPTITWVTLLSQNHCLLLIKQQEIYCLADVKERRKASSYCPFLSYVQRYYLKKLEPEDGNKKHVLRWRSSAHLPSPRVSVTVCT